MVAAKQSKLLRIRRKLLALPKNQLSFPSGRKRGVKRDTKVAIGDRCVHITEVMSSVDEQHWDELCKTEAHLSKQEWVTDVHDQDGIGSCAREATDKGSSILIKGDQNRVAPLINSWGGYQKTSGGRDQGSVIGHNLEDVVERGSFPEEVWPRSKGWRTPPSPEALRVAKLFRLKTYFSVRNDKEFVSALLRGFCVVFGYTGHAIVAIAYLGKGKILYINSWGKSWGDVGFGVLTLDRIRYDYGAYVPTTMIRWNPKDWKPQHNQQQLAKAVNQFMAISETSPKLMSSKTARAQTQRDELYQTCLQKCGLTIST